MPKYITKTFEQTQTLAAKLAKKYKSGAILALIGPLGSGKTTFSQGFAKGLGIKYKLLSPTFILMRQYQIPEKKQKLIHIDLYRLDNLIQIKHLGLEELFADPTNIILIEWAEKLGNLMPKKTQKISLKILDESNREIIFED